MLKVAEGDDSAFRHLVGRHAAKTFALTRRMLGNDADAEEIVQEAMLRVWVNAPRWRPQAAFRTWLYRVTFNLCLNRRRQKSFAPLDEASDPPDPSPSAAEDLERREMDRLVAKAIDVLPAHAAGRHRAHLLRRIEQRRGGVRARNDDFKR